MWIGHAFLDMVRLRRKYTDSRVCTFCPAHLVKLSHLWSLLAHYKSDLV